MPELPEVETVARGLAERISGDTIESVWLGEKPEPLKSPAHEIAEVLDGAKVQSVRRVGKQIAIDLSRRGKPAGQWIVHLGMTGKMLVCSHQDEIPKHTHAIAKLRSGREVRFVDARRFGRLSVVRDTFQSAGLEPLQVSLDEFIALFRGRKTPIKSALLNQKLLGGVGNIYADESLFRAGIRPRKQAGKLTRAELGRLHTALQSVLREAIKAGGSSVSDYVDAEGKKGWFQLRHNVYLRTGEPCNVCGTPIKRVTVAGRGTHYCLKCQK
ncbi:MAG TPA: bifunctional DNA-formamidopyrimidine glycosylase/DNA-(apurinic or apyrimidinic site) lyase [Terriglobales bacterium]|jgi:formamidopyrimidine-DNA glycosylase